MIEWIKNLFTKKAQIEEFKEEDLQEIINENLEEVTELIFNEYIVVQFAIDKSENIHISFSYDNTSVEGAKALANFLYDINRGVHKENIGNILIQQALKSPKDKQYIENVLAVWNLLVNQTDVSPVISPIDFAGNE